MSGEADVRDNYVKCMTCGWRMPESLFQAMKHDVGCPRCKTSFHWFSLHHWPTTSQADAIEGYRQVGPC